MRIKLQKGKQKEIIERAKGNGTWNSLAKKLNVCEGYLINELRNEKRTINEGVYNILCILIGKKYDSYIIKRLGDNWGRSKGGKNSKGNTKSFISPNESEELAEFIGIMLGDGNINSFKKGTKVRCYAIRIAGDLNNDFDYLSRYVFKLIKKLFKEKATIRKVHNHNEVFLILNGINLVKFLGTKGLKPGNKKKNNQTIPNWIYKEKSFLRTCIKGLIDTDGSIHYISRKNRNLRISFHTHTFNLLKDVRRVLTLLGFGGSKIIRGNQIFLSSKEDTQKYIKEVGFNNPKHLIRLQNLRNYAPVV